MARDLAANVPNFSSSPSTSTTTWGQLSWCTTNTRPPIRLMKNTITIGRTSDCDVNFISNKYISGHHCTVSQDENGKVWLTDNSTNGTFVNDRKLKKSKKFELSHKDKIQLVKRPNQPNEDIVLMYQDLRQLEQEENNLLENTEEWSDGTDKTQELNDETNSSHESEAEKSKAVVEDGSKIQVTTEEKQKDAMGETLVCSICQDIFHDCLSLQPCMHSFCSACYSQWMERSKGCPTCRLAVDRMSRNHIINNLVEAYLNEHPEKKRSAEEIAEMDARNKITEDMIRPSRKRKVDDEVDDEVDDVMVLEDDEDSDDVSVDLSGGDTSEGSDDVDTINTFLSGIANQHTSFGALFGFSPNDSRPPSMICRWCPRSGQDGATSSQASNSTTTVGEIRPGVPQPVCPDRPLARHLMCGCCLKPMPIQENFPPLPGGEPYAKSQKCGICNRFFCHLLWKCNKPNCLGCLNEFKDMKFYNHCLDGMILNNKYESQILKNYLNEKGLTIHDLLSKCLEKLDAKSYMTTDLVLKPDLNSNFILCNICALKNFKELAFQFRRDIPRDELPAAVTSRPDCHWGKNCRTQTNPNNPHHASRYNHICEQTRFR